MSAASRRVTYAVVVALVALAAPLILWWLVAPRSEDRWLIALVAVPFLGPLVFELISRAQPRWGYGVWFALVLSVICGIYSGVVLRIEQSGPGPASFVGAFMFGLTLVAGLVGALVAWLIGWTFRKNSASRIARNLRPWHVGAAVALADIIAVAAVAAVAA